MMEGGQACLVGLQTINEASYAESHPRTFKNIYSRSQGRQHGTFDYWPSVPCRLGCLCYQLGGLHGVPNVNVWGLNSTVENIFLTQGIGAILITIMLGQLTSQVNSARCMVDYISNYFMLYAITFVSSAMEFSGILHSVYLVLIIFSTISGKPIESEEPARNELQKIFFWFSFSLFTLALLGISFAVTPARLFQNKTMM